jgi:hypothetical protein
MHFDRCGKTWRSSSDARIAKEEVCEAALVVGTNGSSNGDAADRKVSVGDLEQFTFAQNRGARIRMGLLHDSMLSDMP